MIDKKCDADARFKTAYSSAVKRRRDGEDYGSSKLSSSNTASLSSSSSTVILPSPKLDGRSLTRDKTMNVLKTEFNANIAESKRRGDMLRAI